MSDFTEASKARALFRCPNCKRLLPTRFTVHNCMRIKRSDAGKRKQKGAK